ncbi:sensor domain-containing diguanylate cyclase [Thioalkalivibrio sp. ALJ1]|uniref:sensor domain-containing diguanylate cyclase n=1 Tax=Thioalkalivibrio sp. ALJ1 TaxID=1158144 RepID=UPI0005717DE5|nr:sensor domain-containing diguanylate cyclase [Thioalkalivibrio sp. ALJ1]
MENENAQISRAEYEALRAERDQLLALLRALPDISFVIDTDGLYVRVIGGANETMYIDGKTLEGHTLHEALPAEIADRCLNLVHEAIRTGDLQTVEYPLRVSEVALLPDASRQGSKGEVEQWFEGRVIPLSPFDHPKPVALWVAVNITPRKQLEQYWREAAHTDSLTGVATRLRLFDRARREVERAHRHGRPLCVLMIDFDHFKRINDHYGHATGDDALRAVTRACGEMLRDNDFMGRTGGEEFAVILPETDLEGARHTANRLLETVRTIQLPNAAPDLHLTISIGCARLQAGEGLDRLMRRADEHLYAAKAAGRDRCCGDCD